MHLLKQRKSSKKQMNSSKLEKIVFNASNNELAELKERSREISWSIFGKKIKFS